MTSLQALIIILWVLLNGSLSWYFKLRISWNYKLEINVCNPQSTHFLTRIMVENEQHLILSCFFHLVHQIYIAQYVINRWKNWWRAANGNKFCLFCGEEVQKLLHKSINENLSTFFPFMFVLLNKSSYNTNYIHKGNITCIYNSRRNILISQHLK